MERTLVLVKPDGVQRGLIGEVISRLERRGLRLVAARFMQVNQELAETHYAIHKGKPFYEGLIRYITSAPVMAMVWEGPNAVVAVRPTMGAQEDHTAFRFYSSVSTGKPKGVQHSTAGYLLWSVLTMKWTFDIRPDDLFWCTADIGWVTGHSYIVYGPLANGATSFMYEGAPDFPKQDRWWKLVEEYGITIMYTAPTAIRACMRWGDDWPKMHDLASLRLLGTVGEPINPEAWRWYYRTIGGSRCPVVDTWWQTETGMILITPLPGISTLKPGSAVRPYPGVGAEVVDETGKVATTNHGGYLVLTRPWPAMLLTL